MTLPERPARVDRPFRESVRVLGIYLRAQIVIAVIITVLYAIGFFIAHVPVWPLIAILGGISSLIPRFGSLIALVLVAIAMIPAYHDLTRLLIAFGTWVIVQGLEGFVLQPVLLSKPLGLKALPVFLALLAGGMFFGPIGLLLAVPVLAVANVFWRYFRDRSVS